MRLVFYTENYVIGGCDRFLVDLARRLDPVMFETAFAGNPNPIFDRWLARQLPAQVPRHEVKVWTLPNSRFVRKARPALRSSESDRAAAIADVGAATLRYAQAVVNYPRLRALFRRLRPDVLHINNGGYPGAETCRLAALAARAEGVPAIVHFVHNMAYPPGFPARAERALDRKIDSVTDLWLTAADRATTALHETRGIPLGGIETVHYGLEPPTVDGALPAVASTRRPLITVVASFEPRKGHLVLLDALTQLDRDGFGTTTQLIGEGDTRVEVERRAKQLALNDRVEFLGWRDDVSQLLAGSDLLVLPSIGNECLPYAILEAMALGVPVVSTDVAGIPEEVVDGETGRIVPPGDAAALARAIRDVLSDPARARAMGQKGKERVASEFSLEQMVGRMSEIYLRLGRCPATTTLRTGRRFAGRSWGRR